MQVVDQGIILSIARYSEKLDIVKIFTAKHGIYSASCVLGKKRSQLQPGNFVDFMWKARIESQLGYTKIELIKSITAQMLSRKYALYAFRSISELIVLAFEERDPHEEFFNIFKEYVDFLISENNQHINIAQYIKCELALLKEAGFGLDLSACPVNSQDTNLKYISPKTARAISASGAGIYANKLLPLPNFIIKNLIPDNISDIRDAFNLTGYFFQRYILMAKNKKLSHRDRFISTMLK